MESEVGLASTEPPAAGRDDAASASRDDARRSALPAGMAAVNVQENLAKTRIAPDLLRQLFARDGTPMPDDGLHDVIIEMNSQFPGGGRAAQHDLINACRRGRRRITPTLRDYRRPNDVMDFTISLKRDENVAVRKSLLTDSFVFARLTRATVLNIVALAAQVERDKTYRNRCGEPTFRSDAGL